MDKKKTILVIIAIILFLIVFFLSYLVFNKYVLKRNFENSILPFADKNQSTIFRINISNSINSINSINQSTIFRINRIAFFSSCDAKNKNISANNYTIENLYQYTDMALFISNTTGENTLENTLKKVSIENINFNNMPSLGEPKLYFKSINNFSNSKIIEENIIQDKLDFDVTSQDETNLDTPTLYNNLANPITLSYTNQNIKSDYTITDTSSPITYDGSLLKKCNILLNNISCSLSFDILITNNLDQNFKCTVYIDIPLENETKTIYDGNIILKQNTNLNFYRY